VKLNRIAVFLLLIASLAVAQSGIDGKWVADIMGQPVTYIFKAESESKFTGTVEGEQGSTAIREGTIEGDKISFLVDGEWDGQKFVTSYEGVLKGDQIQLALYIEEFGFQLDLTAKRTE